jgi:hypothetical protein
MGTGATFPGIKRPGLGLTTQLHAVLRLKKGGAIPPLAHISQGQPYVLRFDLQVLR